MARWMDTLDVYEGCFYEVETRCGTQYVPGDLVGRDATPDDLSDYLEGGAVGVEPEDVTFHEGGSAVLWRMTEPGYMDSTPWSMATDADDAEAQAREMDYMDEEEDSEEE